MVRVMSLDLIIVMIASRTIALVEMSLGTTITLIRINESIMYLGPDIHIERTKKKNKI